MIWQIIISKGDLTVLAKYANNAIAQAEASQPEGTKMELEVRGLSVAGIDLSTKIADWLNTKWREGYLKEPSGRRLVAWPQYPNRIAWGSNGTLIIRWVKMFPWGAVIVVVTFAALLILYPIIRPWIKYMQWKLKKAIPPAPDPCEGKTGIAYWWCDATPIERATVIGTFAIIGCFGIWFLVERSLAEAAAPKIIIGGAVE